VRFRKDRSWITRHSETNPASLGEFETCPDWGAKIDAVSILFLAGDPSSTLELAVDV
jgi:hypothetical protein